MPYPCALPSALPSAFPSVYAAFAASAARYPDHDFLVVLPQTAQIYGIDTQTLRYGVALARVDALAARYRAAGFGPGHRAGLMLENRPAFFLHWLALNALGVSVVPLSTELRAAELEYITGHSELDLAVAPSARHADLHAAAQAAQRSVTICEADADADAKAIPRAATAPRTHTPDADTECALLYTSGTTGRPKACVLPNEYFLLAGLWYNRIGGLCTLRPGVERLITPLPMTHMNAMAYSTMAMILAGGAIVALDRFHPRSWWEDVRAARATVIHYLGVMPAMLLGAPPGAHDREHSVRFGFGAGVDKTLHAPFETRFGIPLLEAWAMTETGAGAVVIANREPRNIGRSCFGKPEAALEVRIVGDDGQLAPAGEPGELLVRASGDSPRRGFFREYLKDAEATAAAWEGGWFHTGDIVRQDADGQMYFVDRKKNVIRRSGENISAVEVESVLRKHPCVADVAVAATPDAVRGDEVLACIVTREPLREAERTARAAELVQLCLAQLAYFKAPGFVAFVDALPLTGTQKVQRAALKDLARTLPGTPCCIDTRTMKKRQD
ncbi:AMP-binding protein [Paraburkholderia silviterrae]|uniref:ATP-dependent acyl-CoA ligase n=1 Tax=Paraburkholderia silviterrae TaxID=2528715 RepID=A0A4R5LZU6_9BURK|nr:AMP-binding protein [Paraburkholderia silviterrae]TDG18205.1 ATP-dependent acyl-CoA ligase [Paraburkholderia silviterrae]